MCHLCLPDPSPGTAPSSHPFTPRPLTLVAAGNPHLPHGPSAKHTFPHSSDLVHTSAFEEFQSKPLHTLPLQWICVTNSKQSLLNSLPQQVHQSGQSSWRFIHLLALLEVHWASVRVVWEGQDGAMHMASLQSPCRLLPSCSAGINT